MDHHPSQQLRTIATLIQSAVGILLDYRNATTAKKQNVACVAAVLK